MIVTTAEELAALPVGSVIMTPQGEVAQRLTETEHGMDWQFADGRDAWYSIDATPLTVLHIPGRDLLAEARAEGVEVARKGIAGAILTGVPAADDAPLGSWVRDRAARIAEFWTERADG